MSKDAWSVVNIGPSTRSEMHELGNLIVALQFCLRQLGGRQRSDELEGMVRTGLEVCEQGIVTFRRVNEAVSARPEENECGGPSGRAIPTTAV